MDLQCTQTSSVDKQYQKELCSVLIFIRNIMKTFLINLFSPCITHWGLLWLFTGCYSQGRAQCRLHHRCGSAVPGDQHASARECGHDGRCPWPERSCLWEASRRRLIAVSHITFTSNTLFINQGCSWDRFTNWYLFMRTLTKKETKCTSSSLLVCYSEVPLPDSWYSKLNANSMFGMWLSLMVQYFILKACS